MTPLVDALSKLASNAMVSVQDPLVWAAIALAVAAYVGLLVIGTWAARLVRLLADDAPDSAVVGVGLSFGALLVASVGAAIVSRGQSSLTPVAVGLVAALLLATRRDRSRGAGQVVRLGGAAWLPPRSTVLAGLVLVALALLLGSALAPSPRGGFQPIESMDAAFYAVVGRDLVRSGIETWASPSGFDTLRGLPEQMWYHWGELWLAGLVGEAAGLPPTLARHAVVLPLLLVASMALLAALSRAAFPNSVRPVGPLILGAASGLFLSAIPSGGTYFSAWSTGLLLGITSYGQAATVAFLIAYLMATDRLRPRSTGQVVVLASIVASLIPLHVLLAAVAVVAVVVAAVVYAIVTRRLRRGHWKPGRGHLSVLASASAASVVVVVWGLATGHALPQIPAPNGIAPFNDNWRSSVSAVAAGSLAFGLVPLAALQLRASRPGLASILAGATLAIVTAAVGWGATYASFNSFHLLFGGIAVIGVPAMLVAVGHLWGRIPRAARLTVAAALVAQLGLGATVTLSRLATTNPTDYEPIPIAILDEIKRLEPDAKLAYECRPLEEMSTWLPRLVSLDAHTGRRVIPLCFRAYSLASMLGQSLDAEVVDPAFSIAPQSALFPTAKARPAEGQLIAFLRANGVRYLFVDATHPNTLLPGAVPFRTSGSTQLLRVP